MKQLLIFPVTFIITFTLASFFSASVASAQNIVGINIACRLDDFSRAAQVVGRGGWVTVMAGPGNCCELQEIYDANQSYGVNIVIRGYKHGAAFIEGDAIAWAATLGSLDTHGQKIYFMPWNEPNHADESGGLGTVAAAHAVKNYIANLSRYLGDAGLRNPGDKVALLSPMIDQFAPNFDQFIAELGRGAFFSQFEGIAVNLYDNEDCGSPLCSGNHRMNASQFNRVLDEMGASGKPVFAVETGVVVGYPRYLDGELYDFFKTVISIWRTHGNFRMFSVFSYDPHYRSDWNIFGSRTADLLMVSRGSGSRDTYSSASTPDTSGLVPCDDCCGFAPTEASCVSCWATSTFLEGPVGFLDQFTAAGTGSIGPLERKFILWAPCEDPAGNDPESSGCKDARIKMGISGDLFYPQAQEDFYAYFKEVYPRLLAPEDVEALDEIVSNPDWPGDESDDGWIWFESAGGESGSDSKTTVTHPMAYLFDNPVAAKIEEISRSIWKHLTPPITQNMRPLMIKNDRSYVACPEPGEIGVRYVDCTGIQGCEDENDWAVHFGAMEHLPDLFAADWAEGDYYDERNEIGGCLTCPPIWPGAGGELCKCGSALYKFKEGRWVHIGDEERTFQRFINAACEEDGETKRSFESLNPAWRAYAETWNSIAGPVGYGRHIFYGPDPDPALDTEAEDLFDPHQQIWPVAQDAYKSQLYDYTFLDYKYRSWSPLWDPNANEMEGVEECDTPDGRCRAHFPFLGGLELVQNFICRNINDERLHAKLCPED